MFDASEEQPGTMLARTIKATAICEGIGLHSGQPVRLTVRPAPAGTGILFRRIDLLDSAGPEDQSSGLERITIPASPLAVCQTTLGTVLTNRFGVTISTVEHLLAAFASLGITQAIVEIDGPEVPILDGSAAPFIDLVESVGVRELTATGQVYRLREAVRVQIGDSIIEAEPLAEGEEATLMIDAVVEYDDPAIGRQELALENAYASFREELSAARTFCYLRDVEMMRAKGLALGGSMDNAIVVSEGKVLNEGGLRMEREFVRHKVLDLVGDLYLMGLPLAARITAIRPGHGINTAFARKVIESHAADLVSLDDLPLPAEQARA
ncbi:UDP-3-O-acyl-N-acetylglucosamine deacetylase [Parvularcula marina]|uniref:UDP-3-O-acyl-N-acetylglucosamine deacetylase n=1 Tax=Parvularcula marina TaxID=2292771 RepID=UPI003516F624